MKKIKYLILSLLVVSVLVSCTDEFSDELTGNAKEGGLVGVNNLLISYVVASGATYYATGSVYQGDIQTGSVDIYKTFTDNVSGEVSNKVLLTSIDITDTTIGTTANFEFSFTYEQLIEGITIGGGPLPPEDGGLNIGDFWSLTYESHTSQGNDHPNAAFTKVAVGTRYAGIYTVTESSYWNSGGHNGDWNGTDRIIESVDATIYRHVGLAFWDDNEYFFTVDSDTNYITISPENLDGTATLLNDSPIMTCEGAGGPFESIPCDASTSTAVPDDINGKDVLKLTTGYFRGTGATREFFENLVKQTD